MKLAILVVGRHEEIMATILRLLQKNEGWTATGAMTDEEALAVFAAHPFDMVLLSSGIEDTAEEQLCENLRAINPAITIIQHYGGGSGLLTNEILQALDENRMLKNRQD